MNPSGVKALVGLACAAACLGVGPCGSEDGPVLRLLVMDGDPAPGLPGVVLGSISGGDWTARSELGFFSRLIGPGVDSSSSTAVWMPGLAGEFRLVLQPDAALPQIDPEAWYSGSVPGAALGPAGDAILALGFRVGRVRQGRAYAAVRRGADPEVLAWEGGPVPGAPDLSLSSVPWWLPSEVNRFGEFAFVATVRDPGGTLPDDHAVLGPLGEWSLALIARDGDPVPGRPGEVFLDLDRTFHGPAVVDDARRVTFHADYGPPGGPESGGLFQTDARGEVQPLWLTGDPVPGLGEGFFFRSLPGHLQVSPAGALGFWGGITGPDTSAQNDNVLFVAAARREAGWYGSEARVVMREGDPAPGLPAGFHVFSLLESPAVNDRGEAAFEARAGDFTRGQSVIYFDAGEGPELVVAEGDPIPGMPGKRVGLLGSNPRINAYGDIQFGGRWVSEETGEQGEIFYAIAPREGGFLALALLRGDRIEVVPGDVREVSSVHWQLNDRRELLADVRFTDHSRAYFCTGVPRGSPLRFTRSPCGRWGSDDERWSPSPLDALRGDESAGPGSAVFEEEGNP